jgi:uncharacterized protein Usg
MAPGSVSLLAPDYWLAAQADKDAMHFYTWHKVRRPLMPHGCGFLAFWSTALPGTGRSSSPTHDHSICGS